MNDFNQYSEDFFSLLEGGFIAIKQSDQQSAERLFAACFVLNPTHPMIDLGLGYLHLHKLELSQAIRKFEKIIEDHPDDVVAKTLLGIALALSPKGGMQGEKILSQIASQSKQSEEEEGDAKQVAETALHFVDKHVKKKHIL